MPSVSVIIPAYNAEATIRAALASVEAQTVRDFEVVVVDDASRDGTPRILASEYAGRPGFRVLLNQANSGPAAGRNRATAEARGTWLAYLDGDDVWLPWRLETQLALADRHPGIALWCAGVRQFASPAEAEAVRGVLEGVRGAGQVPKFSALTLREFAWHNPVATSTVLVRRDAVEAAGGFDAGFRGPEDYDLWMRLAARHTLARIEEPLSLYRLVTGSLSMDDRTFLPQVLAVLEKAYRSGGALSAFTGLRHSSLATQYWNASWMAFHRGARVAAVRHWAKAFGEDCRAGRTARYPWARLLWRYLAGRPDGGGPLVTKHGEE